jgi:hypothetical protein
MFKSPKILSYSSKAGLHLITDAHHVAFSQDFIDYLVELLWRNYLPTTTLHILTYECSSVLINDTFHVFRIVLDRIC